MVARSLKPPPWIAFPHVSPEMNPKPGEWADYSCEWQVWFIDLSDEERNEYKLVFPESEGWQGYYEFVFGK